MVATSRKKLLDPKEASEFIRKPQGTMANWRGMGIGPAYIRCGRSIRYAEDDLIAFLEANRVDPSEDHA
ncbi:MAG TPA: helix-turn-helix domain-containing protein [Terriglobales bacterium]|jgi:Helix-turn-helix domain|nr:helix-turn-helix domain-containing protein [Terriglobales bacterium]